MEESRRFGFETRQVHAGQRPDPNTGARAVPIYQTTSYVFEDPESAAAYFNLQEYGNTYSRIMNPTVAVFEERMANLEGGCGAVAFASGIAAQAAALFTLLSPGDHVVSSSALYGGTVNQLKHILRKMSVELTWVDPDDPGAWKTAVRNNTKAFYGETIGNPGGNVLDIEAIAAVAHDHELPLIVDNTFATPFLCRPIEWGADIVVHSATKFIGGHSDLLSGITVARDQALAQRLRHRRGLTGATPGALEAYLALRGLRTLALRLDRGQHNAGELARRLDQHQAVSRVRYPGLPGDPGHRTAAAQMTGFGAVLAFEVADARTADRLCDAVRIIVHATSLGGVESTIERRSKLPGQQHVPAGLLRLSVGCEHIDDLWNDLAAALAKAA